MRRSEFDSRIRAVARKVLKQGLIGKCRTIALRQGSKVKDNYDVRRYNYRFKDVSISYSVSDKERTESIFVAHEFKPVFSADTMRVAACLPEVRYDSGLFLFIIITRGNGKIKLIVFLLG